MATRDAPTGVRLSELLGVLSFGADLGMGQPMEHVLRQCLIALDLADRVGLGADDRQAVFFGSLVAWVGCHIDAYEQAKWFGDETVLKADFRRTDFHTAASGPVFMMRHLGNGMAWHHKLGLVPSFMGEGRRAAESMLENHWRAADDLMAELGLDAVVRDTVEQSFERWDGRGIPKGLKGDEILATARLVNLADVVEVFHRAGGVDAAVSVARQRAGTQFDPELVNLFASSAESLFGELDAVEPWKAVLSAEPASRYWLAGNDLDAALEAVADFCDVKSPFTIGHSRAVADLVSRAASAYGLDAADTSLVKPGRPRPRPRQTGRAQYGLGQAGPVDAGRAGASPHARLPRRADACLVRRLGTPRGGGSAAPRTPRRFGLPPSADWRRHHPGGTIAGGCRQLPDPDRAAPL